MAKKVDVIGTFVFRNEGDGCLTSKYTNSDTPDGPFVEGCKRTSNSIIDLNDVFRGTYRSEWIEDNRSIEAELFIERNQNNTRQYILSWYEPNKPNSIIFTGAGMLFDGLLVGCYWD